MSLLQRLRKFGQRFDFIVFFQLLSQSELYNKGYEITYEKGKKSVKNMKFLVEDPSIHHSDIDIDRLISSAC
jgi:hypothetical protein